MCCLDRIGRNWEVRPPKGPSIKLLIAGRVVGTKLANFRWFTTRVINHRWNLALSARILGFGSDARYAIVYGLALKASVAASVGVASVI